MTTPVISDELLTRHDVPKNPYKSITSELLTFLTLLTHPNLHADFFPTDAKVMSKMSTIPTH